MSHVSPWTHRSSEVVQDNSGPSNRPLGVLVGITALHPMIWTRRIHTSALSVECHVRRSLQRESGQGCCVRRSFRRLDCPMNFQTPSSRYLTCNVVQSMRSISRHTPARIPPMRIQELYCTSIHGGSWPPAEERYCLCCKSISINKRPQMLGKLLQQLHQLGSSSEAATVRHCVDADSSKTLSMALYNSTVPGRMGNVT